jgi:hypothetical protein
MPMRANRVIARIRDVRGGRLNESRFGARMHGQGPYGEFIRDLFKLSESRYGLNHVRDGQRSESPALPTDSDTPKTNMVQLGFDFDSTSGEATAFG